MRHDKDYAKDDAQIVSGSRKHDAASMQLIPRRMVEKTRRFFVAPYVAHLAGLLIAGGPAQYSY